MFYVLAVVTMTVGNFAALTQSNLKRMLAYSSIAHAGYLLIGVVAGTARGVTAMLVYLFVYAFMQLGAFAVLVLMRRHDVVGDELKDLNGLFFRQPFAAVAMLLFMLSLGGIPPTAGFMGKFWLFGAAIESGYVWLAVIGVLNSAVSLYYYIRIVVYMMLKNEPAGSEPRQSPALAVAMGVAVVATLLLGVYPQPLFEFAQASARDAGRVDDDADTAVKTRKFGPQIDAFRAGELFHKVCYIQHARRLGFPRAVLSVFAGKRPQIRTRSGRQLHADWRHHPARRHRIRNRRVARHVALVSAGWSSAGSDCRVLRAGQDGLERRTRRVVEMDRAGSPSAVSSRRACWRCGSAAKSGSACSRRSSSSASPGC